MKKSPEKKMDKTEIIELNDKNMDVEGFAKKALKNKNVLSKLRDNLTAKNETVRYNSAKVLFLISEEHPDVLYSEWDYFVGLLSSDNTYWKCSAIRILANLARGDGENKFEKIFNIYYGLLDDKSIIPAAYVAGDSSKIAKAKPELQTKITQRLLNIDETHHKQERKDLIKSAIIESFNEYYEDIKNKKKIIEFVKKQLECQSPKTRKAAANFLRKWD